MAIALVSALVCLALAAAAAVLVWVIQAALHARVRRARIVRREVVADYLTCLATTTDDRAAAAVLHELDDLAQRDPALRQAAVDGFCAYLRRPALPGSMQQDATGTGPAAQARAAAVQLLQTHLRRSSTGRHWPDMHVNLDGVDVADLDLSNTALRSGSFAGTRFSGTTRFTGARCSGRLEFTAATFTGPVVFDDVDSRGAVRLDGARFTGPASFTAATFHRRVDISAAVFTAAADFTAARFLGDTTFDDPRRGPAQLTARVELDRASFAAVSFGAVVFPRGTHFRSSQFLTPPHVEGLASTR
jgi:uncharacterized protein YjbI with pentapeptide repeats